MTAARLRLEARPGGAHRDRDSAEKARPKQERAIPAPIRQALMPGEEREGAFFSAAGARIPRRAIGCGCFDVVDLGDGRFGGAPASGRDTADAARNGAMTEPVLRHGRA
ncbi:MAG TPA: hypothetical protein PLE61_04005 [Vicinamibacterales bacterium]|nr:hypothetical protein [Vicinamibacterales bacterium]HPW19958.1 hypothetical protein [Vicinamibacterales bacterium]